MKKSKLLLLTALLALLVQPALACQSYEDAMTDLETKLPPVPAPSSGNQPNDE